MAGCRDSLEETVSHQYGGGEKGVGRKRDEIDEKEERIAADALLTLSTATPWVSDESPFFSERNEAAMILMRLFIRGGG